MALEPPARPSLPRETGTLVPREPAQCDDTKRSRAKERDEGESEGPLVGQLNIVSSGCGASKFVGRDELGPPSQGKLLKAREQRNEQVLKSKDDL